MRLQKLQITRRAVQVSMILLLLAIPAVSRYANYVAAREIDKNLEDWNGTFQGALLTTMDTTFRALPEGEKERVGEMVRDRDGVLAYTRTLGGGPWSARLGPFSLSDPLGALESIVARKHVARVVVISLIIPIVLTLLFGRVFCSWICPMGFLLEMTDKLRGLIKFLEIHPRDIHFARSTKFALLIAGLGTVAVVSTPILGYIYPPAIISREAHDLVFAIFDRAEIGKFGFWTGGLTWMSFILLAIIIFEVLISRRWWCRYVCPGGALYIGIGALRPARVELIAKNCTHCADCIKACPMALNPMLNKMGAECDNCGECISSCDDDALKFALWKPNAKESIPIPPRQTLGETKRPEAKRLGPKPPEPSPPESKPPEPALVGQDT